MIKPGLAVSGAAQPMQWPWSWADGASSSLGCIQLGVLRVGMPQEGTSPGMSGVFLTSVGIHRLCLKLEHPPLQRRAA